MIIAINYVYLNLYFVGEKNIKNISILQNEATFKYEGES